jgi:uncharacterized phiE125 gp8 family phage protein
MELSRNLQRAAEDLPVAAFRTHLRLGTGFANEASLDSELAVNIWGRPSRGSRRAPARFCCGESFRLVLRTGGASMRSTCRWRPVASVEAITLRNRRTAPTPIAPNVTDWSAIVTARKSWRLRRDAPAIPVRRTSEIDFTAGFGISWDAVPDDLAQAVLLLAAQLLRGSRTGASRPCPPLSEALIARWIPVRLTAGGHR